VNLELMLKILSGELKLCPRCKGNPKWEYGGDSGLHCQLCKTQQGGTSYVPGYFV